MKYLIALLMLIPLSAQAAETYNPEGLGLLKMNALPFVLKSIKTARSLGILRGSLKVAYNLMKRTPMPVYDHALCAVWKL